MKRPVLDYSEVDRDAVPNHLSKLQQAMVKVAWLCDNFSHSSYEQAQKIGKEVVDLIRPVDDSAKRIPVGWVASKPGHCNPIHLSAKEGWEVEAVLFDENPHEGHSHVSKREKVAHVRVERVNPEGAFVVYGDHFHIWLGEVYLGNFSALDTTPLANALTAAVEGFLATGRFMNLKPTEHVVFPTSEEKAEEIGRKNIEPKKKGISLRDLIQLLKTDFRGRFVTDSACLQTVADLESFNVMCPHCGAGATLIADLLRTAQVRVKELETELGRAAILHAHEQVSVLCDALNTEWCAWAEYHDSHGPTLSNIYWLRPGDKPEVKTHCIRVEWLDKPHG